MGLFHTLRKKKRVEVCSPIEGNVFPITQLGDGVFSERMMGDGFFVRPTAGETIDIYSPIDGRVESVFPTKHAIGIRSEGMMLLLHLGIDTVELGGEPFELFVEEEAEICKGQLLAKMNLDEILRQKKGVEVIVVFPELEKQTFHLNQQKERQTHRAIGYLQ